MNNEKDLLYLRENLNAVRKRIRECALSCGRNENDIMLLVAAKYASCEEIEALRREGVTEFGENRVNTFLEHYEGASHDGINYHFIGSLQKNKVKYLCGKISLLHSLDSLSLAAEIEKRYSAINSVLDCLVEINIASEESKGGIAPEELEVFLKDIAELTHINVCGFMTMAPAGLDGDAYKAYFDEAVRIGKKAWKETLKKEGEPFFSMGMSGSLEAAICAQSSCVRIGYGIFGHK